MPRIIENSREFLINSDYPMDKIIYFKQYDNLPGGESVSIPHNLPFIPLLFGVWSMNADFSDPRGFAGLYANFGYVSISADSTYVHISSVTDSPAYIRIYAFEPSDSHADIPPTNTMAGEFILNSDYKYSKLQQALIVDYNGGVGVSVPHNLGYKPQVMAWEEIGPSGNRGIVPLEGSVLSVNGGYGVQVTETDVKVWVANSVGAPDRIHLRIYAND